MFPTRFRHLSAWASASLLIACSGGGGSGGTGSANTTPTALSLQASTTQARAGDGSIELSATNTDGGTVQWSLAEGSPGSLDATTGNTVHYIPPAEWGIGVTTNVTITASTGSKSADTTIKLTPKSGLFLVAGDISGPGYLDGTGPAAGFDTPNDVAVSADGTVYVADSNNHTIRKITTAGVVTTLAGSPGARGYVDGVGSDARFYFPDKLTLDAAGNLYVYENGNGTIRKIDPNGLVTTLVGTSSSGSVDSTGNATTTLESVSDMTIDSAGNIYAVNGWNTLQEVSPAGEVTTLAVFSNTVRLRALTFNSAGDVYVINACEIDKIAMAVSPLALTRVGGSCSDSYPYVDGDIATNATFGMPLSIAADGADNLYLTDINKNTVRKIASNGTVSTIAGAQPFRGSSDGVGSAARFYAPNGIAVGPNNSLFVADSDNHVVRKIDVASGAVTTLAGTAPAPAATVDGTGSAARFYLPFGVAADSTGNLFVSEYARIRKITSWGSVSTFAGPAVGGLVIGGIPSATNFFGLSGLTIDAADNLYVVDSGNNLIRKLTPSGAVTIFSGDSLPGTDDGAASVASFDHPRGIAYDGSGFIYVTDGHRAFRKLDGAGTTTTTAQVAADTGDIFNGPAGIAFDINKNAYVVDAISHTVRKITPGGVVSIFAGADGTRGNADGVGAAARFNSPLGIAIDDAGHLYVADTGNQAIRKIDIATRAVTTVAGAPLLTGIKLGALPGGLSSPTGITFVGKNRFAITSANSVLMMVLPQ